jgi:hypothetical protein
LLTRCSEEITGEEYFSDYEEILRLACPQSDACGR